MNTILVNVAALRLALDIRALHEASQDSAGSRVETRGTYSCAGEKDVYIIHGESHVCTPCYHW
jgi:hypothetical protein